ncbi:MAG TPA: leucine-rich repeat protein, partial [Paludibacter sp.]|nr:leucine-rich repeat protein [Paludibacter sp.]
GCSGFNGNLTLPTNISTLNSGTFENCTGLTGTVTIPLTVSSILSNDFSFKDFSTHYYENALGCFHGCSKISALIISKNTTSIGDNAFNGCVSLQKITVPLTIPPTIHANTFGDVNKDNCTLEVPIGSSLSYQTANYWSQFILFKEINFELTTNATQTNINNIKIYTYDSEIIIDGTTKGEIVTIYSINGKQIHTVTSKGERIYLPFGIDSVYLIKTGDKTFKVKNRRPKDN